MSKKSGINFGLGLIAGVVGGIIAGVLYAPKSGEQSRSEVKEALSNVVEKSSPEVQEAKKQALETVDLFKYKLERQFRKMTHSFKSQKLLKAKKLEDTDYDFN